MSERGTVLGVIIVVAVGLIGSTFMPKSMVGSYDTLLTVGETKLQVEIARDLFTKYRGLSDRESMCDECGMLFVFDKANTQQFVMRGMKFSLDFVFIREGQVVGIQKNISPPVGTESPAKIISTKKADQVLELNAGAVESRQIRIGDSVNIDL